MMREEKTIDIKEIMMNNAGAVLKRKDDNRERRIPILVT